MTVGPPGGSGVGVRYGVSESGRRPLPPLSHPWSDDVHELTYGDVKAAADRIAGRVRPVVVAPFDAGVVAPDDCEVWVALEYLQHTGSFKARGAQNFIAAHRDAGTLPAAGVTIASGGNAGLACAWAARQQGVPATVFVPETAPAVKVARLRGYGADVRLAGTEYADALAACERFAADTGALASHAYADTYVSAGAGTLMDEIRARIPELDTVVVAVGGGGLFAGVAVAAQPHGIRTVAVEPEDCRALNAALEAGHLVDVEPRSVAADSLGAPRTWPGALTAAQHPLSRSTLVTDQRITAARRHLWDHYRIAIEHGTAAALAALLPSGPSQPASSSYRPASGEKVAVILCGANTDPSDLAAPGE